MVTPYPEPRKKWLGLKQCFSIGYQIDKSVFSDMRKLFSVLKIQIFSVEKSFSDIKRLVLDLGKYPDFLISRNNFSAWKILISNIGNYFQIYIYNNRKFYQIFRYKKILPIAIADIKKISDSKIIYIYIGNEEYFPISENYFLISKNHFLKNQLFFYISQNDVLMSEN